MISWGGGRIVRCGCQAPPGRPHHVRHFWRLLCGGGEKFAVQAVRDAAAVWAGGLHSGWNARMLRERGWGVILAPIPA